MKWRTNKERTDRTSEHEEDAINSLDQYSLEYLSESGTIDIDTCEA